MTQAPFTPPAQLTIDEDQARVASYASYPEAQAAVDLLSDSGFPVAGTHIVGRDLQSVELVTGRMTKARAAQMGIASGAWLGLFLGFIVVLFTDGNWMQVMLTTVLLGMLWGAMLGFLGQLATRGKRDFSSTGGFVAQRYDIMVDRDKARAAAEILNGWVRRYDDGQPESQPGAGGSSPVEPGETPRP